jgi:hypothetical protein
MPTGTTAAAESPPSNTPASADTAPPPNPVETLLSAQRLVDSTEHQYGPQAMQLVNPLLNLATMQQALQDYSAAARNYRRAARIVEAHEGANSQDLVTALTGLSAIFRE